MVSHFLISPSMEGGKACSLRPCISAVAKKLLITVLEEHRAELDGRIDYRSGGYFRGAPQDLPEQLETTEDLIREIESMPECG